MWYRYIIFFGKELRDPHPVKTLKILTRLFAFFSCGVNSGVCVGCVVEGRQKEIVGCKPMVKP